MKYPNIRLADEQGTDVVRDGLIATFFMRASHLKVGPAAAVAFDRYSSIVGLDKLNWAIGSEQWERIDKEQIEDLRQEMAQPEPAWTSLVDVAGSGQGPPSFRFRYGGKCLEDPTFVDWDTAISSVTCWFPMEYLAEVGPARFRQQIISIAEVLPFNTGYSSVAFVYKEGTAELAAFSGIRKLALRYPGIDVYDLLQTEFLQGTFLRGVYWLTFIGPPVLERLGGVSVLQSLINDDGISIK